MTKKVCEDRILGSCRSSFQRVRGLLHRCMGGFQVALQLPVSFVLFRKGLLARRCVPLASLLFAAACNQPTVSSPGSPSTADLRTFEGTWSASGMRQTLNLGFDHRSSIFDLSGSLLLIGDNGLGVGFQAQAIGFTDTLAGMQGRCVWTDDRGDKVYSELKGEFVATGNHIVGTIVGGTGRYAGVTGEYSFQWRFIVASEDGTVGGRAVDLKGWARLVSATAAPSGEHNP